MKLILIMLLILVATVQAKEYKAVFDCSSGDAYYIKTRMWLIDKTMSMIEEKGDKATFALTLHGRCVPMVSKVLVDAVDLEDLENIEQAQKNLIHLAKNKGVKITACAMSLKANSIDQKDVLDFIEISPNSFIDAIAYQNDGYALMTFK